MLNRLLTFYTIILFSISQFIYLYSKFNKNQNYLNMKKSLLIILIAFSSLLSAQNTFLTENFDYAGSVEIRNHAWNAHSGGTTAPIKTTEIGLSMPKSKYVGSNIGRAAAVVSNGSDENKQFSKSIEQPATDSVSTYVSFMFKPNGPIPAPGTANPYFFHIGQYANPTTPVLTSLNSSFRGRIFLYPGTAANTFRLNLSFNQNVPDSLAITGNYSSTETHLIVLKYTSVAGPDNDKVSLYVFKDGDDISKEPSKPTIGPVLGTAAPDIILQNVVMRQYLDGQNAIVDGIYVRDAWKMTETSTNISNIETPEAYLSPNPSSQGKIAINTSLDRVSTILVHDAFGRLVESQKNNVRTIDASNFAKGFYFVTLQNEASKVVKKLIIE